MFTVALLTANYGLIDLIDGFTGYVDQSRNQVLDVGWGAIFGIALPLGLLSQLSGPERRIAGLQQTALVIVALAAAGILGHAKGYLLLAAILCAGLAILLALHPARPLFLRGGSIRPVFFVLAGAAALPCLVYVGRMTSAQRQGLPPFDAVSNGLQHWPVMAALGLTVVLLALLAGLGTGGWWIPAVSAGLSALAWGVSCALGPESVGSEGRGWAWAAIVWGIVTIGAATLETVRDRSTASRSASAQQPAS